MRGDHPTRLRVRRLEVVWWWWPLEHWGGFVRYGDRQLSVKTIWDFVSFSERQGFVIWRRFGPLKFATFRDGKPRHRLRSVA